MQGVGCFSPLSPRASRRRGVGCAGDGPSLRAVGRRAAALPPAALRPVGRTSPASRIYARWNPLSYPPTNEKLLY